MGGAVMTLYTPISGGTDALKKAIDDALTKDQETLVLASLPADTWTDFPASIANPGRPIAGMTFRSSAGELMSLDTQFIGDKWQVRSGLDLTNVQILLEY
jgi:hypothetical protein